MSGAQISGALRYVDGVGDSSHLVNVLGAFGLAVAEDVEDAVTAAAGTPVSVPSAVNVIGGWGDGSSIDTLARALGLTHSRAVRVADRLARDGVLVRTRSQADGRAVALRPTPDGSELAEDVQRRRTAAVREWLEPLDGREVAQLEALLDKMLEARVAKGKTAVHLCRLCDAVVCGHPEGCPVTRGSRAADPSA